MCKILGFCNVQLMSMFFLDMVLYHWVIDAMCACVWMHVLMCLFAIKNFRWGTHNTLKCKTVVMMFEILV
jgi:hypothetical protein